MSAGSAFKGNDSSNTVYMGEALDITADLEAIAQMAARLAIDN